MNAQIADPVLASSEHASGLVQPPMPLHWLTPPVDYHSTWQAMRDFTDARDAHTPDQMWAAEHAPVYTQGLAGKPEHLLNAAGIPVVQTDRGGQITYHGPGQIVIYVLRDLHRAGYFVREYVKRLEQAVIDTLTELGVPDSQRKDGAPGVYVPWQGTEELAKIAALGIKVRKGCTYHGVSLNVDMDLSPFLGINPCGYAGLRTVDIASCGVRVSVQQAGETLAANLRKCL